MHYTLYPKGVCSTQIDLDVTLTARYTISATPAAATEILRLWAQCARAPALRRSYAAFPA